MYDRSGKTLEALFSDGLYNVHWQILYNTIPFSFYYAVFICSRNCPIRSLLGSYANIREVYRQVPS